MALALANSPVHTHMMEVLPQHVFDFGCVCHRIVCMVLLCRLQSSCKMSQKASPVERNVRTCVENGFYISRPPFSHPFCGNPEALKHLEDI